VLVVDASVLAPVVADGGPDGARYRHRLRGEQVAAPDLVRVEVLSVLRRQLLLGALKERQAAHAVQDLLALPVTVYPTSLVLARCWQLRDNVTAYDACYVALAESLGCALLTADARLGRAPGPACPVEVI
jgi:predicted nucleic acid-binding protein